MQAVLANTAIREMENEKDELISLFSKLDTADNTQKNSIENEIVGLGSSAIDFLIATLTSSKGTKRGVAAMSLIRIGEDAIAPLKDLAEVNSNFAWVSNYIIREIQGTL